MPQIGQQLHKLILDEEKKDTRKKKEENGENGEDREKKEEEAWQIRKSRNKREKKKKKRIKRQQRACSTQTVNYEIENACFNMSCVSRSNVMRITN